jgi:hypothetical protein
VGLVAPEFLWNGLLKRAISVDLRTALLLSL